MRERTEAYEYRKKFYPGTGPTPQEAGLEGGFQPTGGSSGGYGGPSQNYGGGNQGGSYGGVPNYGGSSSGGGYQSSSLGQSSQ